MRPSCRCPTRQVMPRWTLARRSGVIGGVRQNIHFLCMDLPQSDACFVKAYPRETTEAFLDGHVSAFAFFGGVPLSILYDNTKIAVAKICGDGRRERTRAFTELVSHYLFQDRFGRPGKGNDKGKVEGLVNFSRSNFMVTIPVAASFEALNAKLLECCRKRQEERTARHAETIGERLKADLASLRPLPDAPFEPCEKRSARVSSTALVRYRCNDYSVPTAYGFQSVLVKGFVDEVVILCEGVQVAHHSRAYGQGVFVYNPLHYLALIETEPGALDQAAALQDWDLPADFQHLRHLLEARMGSRGKREFIQVLRLLEVAPMDTVAAAVTQAIQLGAIGFDAVKQILLPGSRGGRPGSIWRPIPSCPSPTCAPPGLRTTPPRSRWRHEPNSYRRADRRLHAGRDHSGRAPGPAGPPPEAAEAPYGAARVRQGGARGRPRWRRSPALPAEAGRAGAD